MIPTVRRRTSLTSSLHLQVLLIPYLMRVISTFMIDSTVSSSIYLVTLTLLDVWLELQLIYSHGILPCWNFTRGAINNAVKLAYNPTKSQRDQLYATRINPVINLPGAGIVLYGDKTAIGYASAFDRINVRQLFLTVEEAIEGLAQDVLFEFNDAITRTSFTNCCYSLSLRMYRQREDLTDFRVICDETNNTPDVIDNNEFRADIFIKPNKVINYVTLQFVATKEGLTFSEITGTV